MEKENFYVNIQKTVINIIQKTEKKIYKRKRKSSIIIKNRKKRKFFFFASIFPI
jgi:hypothetical protein